MPNVLNEFAGDGVTQTFNFSMTGGYLSRDYVYFFTRPNDDLLNYTPYNDDDVTWLTDFSVRTANPIPVGTTFVILRSTTLDPLVDFQNTSRITEKNLDTATWQSIHIAAETSDTVGRIQVVATDAKEESALALELAQEAADDAAASAASALAAQASAGSAQAAALAAQAEAMDASADAAAAVLTASQAEATANAAEATANAASTAAGAATSTANAAAATANAATATANAAATDAAAAVGTANGASATANAASAAAASATSTANNALTIANEAKDLIDEAVAGAVVSFNGRAGVVTPQTGDYTKAMVGLGNVDNTADVDKPVSAAQSNAIGLKADKSYVDTQLNTKADKDLTNAALAQKADTSAVNSALSLKADTSAMNAALSSNATADRNRANHTGTQAISTVAGLQEELNNPTAVSAINGGQLAGYRNVLHNGAMAVWQRGEGPFTPTNGTASWYADRWAVTRLGSGNFNVLMGTDAPSGQQLFESLTLQATGSHSLAAGDAVAISQGIEGYDARRLLGKTFTLSFWVKAARTGTYGVSFRSPTASKVYVLTYTISTANAWQKVVLTVPGGIPSDSAFNVWGNGKGAEVMWGVNAGSNFKTASSGSWVAGNFVGTTSQVQGLISSGDTFKLTGVQLELGTVATEFEQMTASAETARCQRYYQRRTEVVGFGGVLDWQFTVQMRATPVITVVPVSGLGSISATYPASDRCAFIGQPNANGVLATTPQASSEI